MQPCFLVCFHHFCFQYVFIFFAWNLSICTILSIVRLMCATSVMSIYCACLLFTLNHCRLLLLLFSQSQQPSEQPTMCPSTQPSEQPSCQPSEQPSTQPSEQPSSQPTEQPTMYPSEQPSRQPSERPSAQPTRCPTARPTSRPTSHPTPRPTAQPTRQPTEVKQLFSRVFSSFLLVLYDSSLYPSIKNDRIKCIDTIL